MSTTTEQTTKLTPWEVKGKVDYLAQINHFGTNAIDGALIQRWEAVTKTRAHRFIRRGLVFSHQDLNLILDDVAAGKQVYIYTGRGPSSESMHLGHLVPFMFTKYLQDALNCFVVIQMSDDEKFFFKDGSSKADLLRFQALGYKNAKDIIACGFDVNKTFIFSNLERNRGELYLNNTLIMKHTSMNQIRGIYGLGESVPFEVVDCCKFASVSLQIRETKGLIQDAQTKNIINKFITENDNRESSNSVGQCVWPCFQCGPAFSTSFPFLNSNGKPGALTSRDNEPQPIRCLVPMAIDQAPYFRMARDVASKLECPKPAVIHSEFLPGLRGQDDKMSSTGDPSVLFLDMDVTKINKHINRYAFSGGRDTLEEHRQFGANLKIDICYQYLTYFLEEDNELEAIAKAYSSGEMTTGQIKKITGDLLTKIIINHQEAKAEVDDEVLSLFYSENGKKITEIDRSELESNDYSKMGIDFDRTFGY
jgi:tryptophanyl-tRNA synthetase